MPKFINNENLVRIKAVKEFTDREEPRKVFWKNYDQIKNNMKNNIAVPINVITYYGYGGIGKSRLLLKIRDEMIERENDIKYEFLDFEKIAELNNNLLEILKYIKYDLNKKYNFSFPFFDLAIYEYETKLGKDVTKKELASIFEENAALSVLTDVLEEIPIISPIAKIVSIIDRSKTILKSKLQENRLKEKLLEINKMTAEEMKTYLPYYFSIDLKENIKNDSTPFVFLIDTYEKLVNELSSSMNALDNDLWLRGENGLILNIPNTLWVLAGREKIKWEEIDTDWNGSIEQHILENLSFLDTKTFLTKAGIEEENLIHQIYGLTRGYPIFIDMCVDIYISLKNQGKTFSIEECGKDTTDLIKRFFMYMNDSERDFSTLLAFIPYWTDEDIEKRVLKLNGTFSYSLYEKVKTFSFIVKEDGHYKVQNSIKDIIMMNTPEIIKNKYNREIEEQVLEKVKEIDIKEDVEIEKKMNSELIENLKNELKKEISEETIKQIEVELETKMNIEIAQRIVQETTEEILKQKENLVSNDSNKIEKTQIDINEETKIETQKVIRSKKELRAISNINNYSSKYEFEQIIENQRNKLDNSKDEYEFRINTNLFIKLVLQYEEKFDRNYFVKESFYKTVKQWDTFKGMIEAEKLRAFEQYSYEYISFERFEQEYGDSEETLFNEIHKCRWQMDKSSKGRTKFRDDKVKELINRYYGKDSLYGYCTIDSDYEFVEKILNYHGNINTFYIRLLLKTINEAVLKSYLTQKYPNIKLTSDYNCSDEEYTLSYEFYHLHMNEIFKPALSKCFNVLKSNEQFINYSVLKEIFDLADEICDNEKMCYEQWSYYDVDDANKIFDFIYSIRYMALNTNDTEILQKFKEIFYTFLGGINNDKIAVFKEDRQQMAKEFLKELSVHFIELYGDSSYDAYEIDNFLNKETMTVERLNKTLSILIENFGSKSPEVTNNLIRFLSGIEKAANADTLTKDEMKYYTMILERFSEYVNILLGYFRKYEFDNTEHNGKSISFLFKSVMMEQKHIKRLEDNTFDVLISLALESNAVFFKDDDIEYLERLFRYSTIKQELMNDKLENKYKNIILDICKNKRILKQDCYNYFKPQICDSYVIYKFFAFLTNNSNKRYELHSRKDENEYGKIENININDFEMVRDSLKYLTIKLAEPHEYSDKYEHGFYYFSYKCYKRLALKEKQYLSKTDMNKLKVYFKQIENLYKLYQNKYGEDSDETVILKSYKYIFETFMYMTSGAEMLDIEVQKYRNRVNKNEETLEELEELKTIKDYYIFIIEYYYKEQCEKDEKHAFRLQNWTLDDIITEID